MYIDSVNNKGTDAVLSALSNVIICNDSVSTAKTITFPIGYQYETNISFKVLFVNGHNCVDSSTNMTINDILVVSNKYGSLIPLPIHEMTEGGATVYKSLQANTVLEMYYTSNYDGDNTPAFVVVGNPIVISNEQYTIYADGEKRSPFPAIDYASKEQLLLYRTTSSPTKFYTDPKIMPYDGYIIEVTTLDNSSIWGWGDEYNNHKITLNGQTTNIYLERVVYNAIYKDEYVNLSTSKVSMSVPYPVKRGTTISYTNPTSSSGELNSSYSVGLYIAPIA